MEIVRRQLLILMAALVLATATSTSPGTATPVLAVQSGATFNDPTGSESKQFAIINRLIDLINGTRRGAVIRMAMFSFTMPEFADALVRAHKRGVSIQLINDDHERWPLGDPIHVALGGEQGLGQPRG